MKRKLFLKSLASLLSLSFYLLLAFGSSNDSKVDNSSGGKTNSSIYSSSSPSVSEACRKEVTSFFNNINVGLYNIDSHGKTIILFIEERQDIKRPEGLAETACSFVTEYGFDMVSLRNMKGETIARSMCN